MNYVLIGKMVNTHGLKGEIRILSDFKYKKEVFKKGMNLYFGFSKEKKIIETYRVHKNYDMVTLKGHTSIDDVIKYKGDLVYIDRKDLKEEIILDEDLIGFSVYKEKSLIGKVESILKNKANNILVVTNNENRYLIPNISEFVKNVNIEKKEITINVIKGLLDEN